LVSIAPDQFIGRVCGGNEMTYRGHVRNGVVVLDAAVDLPEGVAVDVIPVPNADRETIADRFGDLVGCVSDLPSDLAAKHDHHLYRGVEE
jgi:hypothetical protein